MDIIWNGKVYTLYAFKTTDMVGIFEWWKDEDGIEDMKFIAWFYSASDDYDQLATKAKRVLENLKYKHE